MNKNIQNYKEKMQNLIAKNAVLSKMGESVMKNIVMLQKVKRLGSCLSSLLVIGLLLTNVYLALQTRNSLLKGQVKVVSDQKTTDNIKSDALAKVVPACPRTAEKAELAFGGVPAEQWLKVAGNGCGWTLKGSGEKFYVTVPNGYTFDGWDGTSSQLKQGPAFGLPVYSGTMWKIAE